MIFSVNSMGSNESLMAGKDNDTKNIGKYLELAILLPVSTMIGYAMGYGLDKLFGTSFLYLIFIFIGTAAGIVQLVRELNKMT